MTQHERAMPDTQEGGEVPDTPERITRIEANGFFVADYATVQDGKVFASGAYFKVLRFPAFPATLPSMALVAVIEVPFHHNQQDHALQMGLLDPDRKPTSFEVHGSFRTAPKLETKFGEPGNIPFAVPLYGLQLPTPGKYTFTLSIDGRQLATYTVDAIQVATIQVPRGVALPPQE